MVKKDVYRYDVLEGNDHISKTISFMRFPLIVMVVFIHSYISMPYYGSNVTANMVPIFFNIQFLLSEIIACIAVPLFFLISGFLFFYKLIEFNSVTYTNKLKKRYRSLFIPYIFWDLLAIVITFIIQILFPSVLSGQGSMVISWKASEWFQALWGGVSPHNIPLWFVRDLMVVVILSPMVFFIVKYLKIYGILGLCTFYILGLWIKIPGFSVTSLFFFSFGAYFSLNGIDFVMWAEKNVLKLAVLFFVVTSIIMMNKDLSWLDSLKGVNNIVGLFFFVGVSSFFIRSEKWKISPLLLNASFFIYAYHGIFSERFLRFFFLVINPATELSFIGIYIVTALLLVLGGIMMYSVCNRLSPKFTSFITGSR